MTSFQCYTVKLCSNNILMTLLLVYVQLEIRQQITRKPLQPLLLTLAALLFGFELILFRIVLRRLP